MENEVEYELSEVLTVVCGTTVIDVNRCDCGKQPHLMQDEKGLYFIRCMCCGKKSEKDSDFITAVKIWNEGV